MKMFSVLGASLAAFFVVSSTVNAGVAVSPRVSVSCATGSGGIVSAVQYDNTTISMNITAFGINQDGQFTGYLDYYGRGTAAGVDGSLFQFYGSPQLLLVQISVNGQVVGTLNCRRN